MRFAKDVVVEQLEPPSESNPIEHYYHDLSNKFLVLK
jgi:hypothetical protein